MPRTALTPQAAPGAYPSAWSDLTFAATDLANGNQFASTGKEVIVVRNDDASSQSITLKSVNDPYGRSGDLVKAIAANAYAMIGPVSDIGWKQTDGNIYIDTTDVDLMIAVITIP